MFKRTPTKLGDRMCPHFPMSVLGSSVTSHNSRMKSTLNYPYKESLPVAFVIDPPDSVRDAEDSEKIHCPQSLGQELVALIA